MGTRAVYIFNDKEQAFSVYGHWDGYPEHAAANLIKTLEYAWPLPRFEASDFAAAFIAGNKKEGGGDVYFTKGPNAHGDLEYIYELHQNKLGGLMIRAFHADWDDDKKKTTKKKFFDGSLCRFVDNYGDEETKQLADNHWNLTPKAAAA